MRLCSLGVSAILVAIALSSSAQEDAALESKLRALEALHHGKLSVYAVNLQTGQSAALNADVPVQTASVIKLAILFEALEQVRAGKASFADPISFKNADAVAGSGVLPLLDTPQVLTFKDVLTLMIVLSDNTATNLVIDHLGLHAVDDRITALALKHTWLYKKVYRPSEGPMPADQKQFGLGKTTAREMASVMERFVRCDLHTGNGHASTPSPADQKLCDAALHMLKSQFYRGSIPRYLESADTTESESHIANKTGALDAVRNDVGVVYTAKGPIVISEFTWDNKDQGWSVDNEAEVLMAKVAKAIVDVWASVAAR